ncbi:MAG: imidazole glycerol phosphate synthase subunit HisH [Actinomycetota bacterium]|nr:imidazole glycerol phosphate synthase subunit HisH [Actinomycetota bacterium]MDH5223893.1 imidazole glycerol phosphate synthase subunit HisH [Actinomycetota bacterium]MDH5313454.1 imidazole glycerol phosphate synthase subunit HisH [Actinomycetota bacterium]
MASTIAVVDYGSGNLHSVSRAIARVGGSALVTRDAGEIAGADALVIPGVGHFGACMRAICHHGMDLAIEDFLAAGRPIFGVCVGMQVLFEGSDEDPEPGLGIVSGRVERLTGDVKVPHMGWNTATWTAPHAYLEGLPDGTRFYFVHSFAPPTGVHTVASTTYGSTFSAAVAHDNVFATQFHPEKSGEPGLHVYERFVRSLA